MAKAKKAAAKKATGRKRTGADTAHAAVMNKITVKGVVGKVEFEEGVENGDEIDLMVVHGFMRGMKVGESNMGEWTALLGTFEAIRASDSKLFSAPKCFLPKSATELIVDAFKQAEEQAKRAAEGGATFTRPEIKFAFNIGARYDDTISVKYQYTCEPLMQEQNDQMASLRSEVLKQLPAPKKE